MKTFAAKLSLIAALAFNVGPLSGQKLPVSEIIQEVDVLMRNYQFNNALVLMDNSEDSLHVDLLQRRGLCYSRLGEYGAAIAAYEKIQGADSLNREALYQLGQLYAVSDLYPQAISSFQKLIFLDSTNSYYYKHYAAAAVKAEDLIHGIAGYMQAVSLNPRDMEAYAHLSNILLEAEQYHFVDSMLSDVLATTENKQVRLLRARANLGEERYDAVVENIEKLLISSDTTATYARLMGISYFQLEEYSKVIPCMEFLIRKGIKADWIFYYLGVSYQQMNDPLKGIEFLNLAIEEGISDNIGTYYQQLGMAYEEMKDFGNAIRTYIAAYQQSKADILLYHLARNYDVYYKDKKQAQIYYRKYLDSDDTLRMAKKYSAYRLEILSDVK
jgi:tetratricopeptide (TPR) repeat protein